MLNACSFALCCWISRRAFGVRPICRAKAAPVASIKHGVLPLTVGWLLGLAPASAGSLIWPTAPSAEALGLSSVRLAQIERVTESHIRAGSLPGAVMLVARKGQVAWYKAMGQRTWQGAEPMQADSIFRIYSMTKPVVTVAALRLAEEGRLDLRAPVSRYLPEMAHMKVFRPVRDALGRAHGAYVVPDREMRIIDLLSHTSGLTYGNGGDLIAQAYREARVLDRGLDRGEQLRRAASLPLAFTPGERWAYGISTDVLGWVLEAIEGESLGQILQRRVFTPLGMTDTGFVASSAQQARLAQPALPPEALAGAAYFDPTQPAAFESGGAGLLSTLPDFFRFVSMLASQGELDGQRILHRDALALMLSDRLGGRPGPGAGYGYGLGVEVRLRDGTPGPSGRIGEFGWSGAAGTLFFVDPQRALIAIYLVQARPEDRVRLREEFRRLVYGSLID